MSSPPSEPVKASGAKRWLIAAGIAVPTIGVLTASVIFLPAMLGLKAKRPDLILHTAQMEMLPVMVVERGTLESADNREVVCKVKAGARGTFATSIKWVIDDGSTVSKGQPVVDLDDSALRDQETQQNITLSKANTAWIKAKEDRDIQVKVNLSDIAAKKASLEVAELDLDKFLGIEITPKGNALGAVLSSMGGYEEKGEYRMKLDDVTSSLKLAMSDLEAYRDRSAWAERATRTGYLTPAQALVEQTKLASASDKVEKLRKEKFALENYTRPREVTDLLSKVKVAKAAYEQAILQANAKRVQVEAEESTAYSVMLQENDKLTELREQLAACKLVAPQNGMVVYYKDPNVGRFGGGSQGLIAVGEQVKEGQKLIRIPDLARMQVVAKIHEALVARIRGDDRRPMGVSESARVGLLLNTSAFGRLLSQSEWSLEHVRELQRDKEYSIVSEGQPATIRVDALPDRAFKGHVRSVAAVAAQADWSSSDVKLFPAVVSIDDTDVFGLKPDMSAEVSISIESGKNEVLTVPMQSIVGRTDLGAKRKLYVMQGEEPVEREVTLGMFNDKKVEVRDGLKEGERVVLNPKAILGDNAKGTREEGDPSSRGAGKGAQPGGGPGSPGGAPGGSKGKGAGGPGAKGGAGSQAGGAMPTKSNATP